jgi:hypothetical protein
MQLELKEDAEKDLISISQTEYCVDDRECEDCILCHFYNEQTSCQQNAKMLLEVLGYEII